MTNWADFTPVSSTARRGGAVDWSQFEPLDVEPKSPGVLRHVADTGLQLAQGVLQGGEMLANTFGADNPVSGTLRKGSQWLASNFSDQLKWEQLTTAREMDEASASGSTWEEVKAAAKGFGRDPVGFLVNAAGTSLPTIAAAFLPGGQGAVLGRLAAMGAAGAAQGAGAVKGQIFEEVQKVWKEAGASEEEALTRATAAQEYLGSNAGQIAIGTALGVLAGGTGIEGSIAMKAMTPGIKKSVIPRLIAEGVKEAIPEAMQGGQEQLAANVAVQNEGFERDTWRGVAGGATLEGLAGGMMGGAFSPLTRPVSPASAEPKADPIKDVAPVLAAPSLDAAIAEANAVVEAPVDTKPASLPQATLPQEMGGGRVDEALYEVPPPSATLPQTLPQDVGGLQGTTLLDPVAQREADRPPPRTGEPQPGDILNPRDEPFTTMTGAVRAQRAAGPEFEIVPVAAGLVVRRKAVNPAVDPAAVPAGGIEAQAAPLEPGASPASEPLLTTDGFPYGTKSGAVARARREGLGPESVVQTEGGFAVRTEEAPSVEPDVSGVAPLPAGPADGRSDLGLGGERTLGSGALEPQPVHQAAEASATSSAADQPVVAGDPGNEALKPGDTFEREGFTWNVTEVTPRVVRATNSAGTTKNIAVGSRTWKEIVATAYTGPTMAEVNAISDIPTIERMREAIDTIGEAEFERRVQAAFKEYRPTDEHQQAMLVESVAVRVVALNRRKPAPTREAKPNSGSAKPNSATAEPASATPPAARPELADTASWVIKDKATGAVVMETFDRKKVKALNTKKYEAVPTREHLASLNRPPPSAPASQPEPEAQPNAAPPGEQPQPAGGPVADAGGAAPAVEAAPSLRERADAVRDRAAKRKTTLAEEIARKGKKRQRLDVLRALRSCLNA